MGETIGEGYLRPYHIIWVSERGGRGREEGERIPKRERGGREEGERKEMGEGKVLVFLETSVASLFAHTRCFCDSSSFFRASQASTSPAPRVQTQTSSLFIHEEECNWPSSLLPPPPLTHSCSHKKQQCENCCSWDGGGELKGPLANDWTIFKMCLE